MEKDIAVHNQALQEMTYDLLRDKDGLNLRGINDMIPWRERRREYERTI